MRGKACSRRGTLATVCAGWRRAFPLVTAAIMLLPGGVAFAATPVDGAAAVSLMQAETERRCIIRCNDPERPPPGTRLREAATKARTTVREAREEVRQEVQEARQDVREATQDVREDLREATGRAREVAGEVKEAAGEVKEAGSTREALAEVREGAGEVKQAIADPESQPRTPDDQKASQTSPAQVPATQARAVSGPPASTSQLDPAASGLMSAAPPALSAASAPDGTLDPSAIGHADPSTLTVAPRPDGVAGGPNSAAQRTESGAIGQSKAPDAATPPVPSVASTPPTVQQEPPAASALAVAPPAIASTENPPRVAADPDAASAATTPAAESEDDLSKWSVPLAVAGAALAGLALVYPATRRQQPALVPAHADGGVSSDRVDAPTSPGQMDAADRAGNRADTRPGTANAPAAGPTLLTRSMRTPTSHTIRPVRDSIATAPNVRLHGSPVPYLWAVGQVSRGHTTNVDGLVWPEPASEDRADRALA